MTIGKIPGTALSENLDRQGLDLGITTDDATLLKLDLTNFRIGINTNTPRDNLEVVGNILVTTGNLLTSIDSIADIGTAGSPWNAIHALHLHGTLQTSAQPNITTIGILNGLTVRGDIVGNITGSANIVMNYSQPNITDLGDLTELVVLGDSFLSDVFVAANSYVTIGDNIISNVQDPIDPQDAATKSYVDFKTQTAISYGNVLPLGTPIDTSLTSSGACQSWTADTKITDAIDDLNEIVENIRNNTFVKSVSFLATPTAGGAGTTVTLALSSIGNATNYNIIWGDGTTVQTTSSLSPTHTYATNSGSPYTVTVEAYNVNGSGTGSAASSNRIAYITIYTANPVASFVLYKSITGGTALTGNNLYVSTAEEFFLTNTTTNTINANVSYRINWGDSTTSTITDNSAVGGVLGDRISHSYTNSSGSGLTNISLAITSHSTASPSVIPNFANVGIKVYSPTILAPNGLNTKTIGVVGATGNSPRLASGYRNNTLSSTMAAGDTVSNRLTATTGIIESTSTSTFAYDADVGSVSAFINDAAAGTILLTTANNAGTSESLTIIAESDYNLLDVAGTATTFANSLYLPGLYTGFTAKVATNAATIPAGLNNMQLRHSVTGNTNIVSFVKDDLISTPIVSTGTLSVNTPGVYRYISGVPYFNTGFPRLQWSGVAVSLFIGQTYSNTNTVVTAISGTNYEGTTTDSIATTTYTYAQIDGIPTMLTSGIPNADTGKYTGYNIGNLLVPITTNNVRTIETIKLRADNVNGTGLYTESLTKVQVHTAAQSGISEIAIVVATAGFGNGTFIDAGVRIFDFKAATIDTPSYTRTTNFYTNQPYTEAADLGVAGTKEATVRVGVIKHDVTNYEAGYLPIGPNRSADIGTQYFTFAFRRQVVANFNINLVSPTGVSGVWIAAPGTACDNTSSLNGWLDANSTYAGSGVPGSNTAAGGNGSNGCALTSGDRIQPSTALSGGYTMTLGSENMTNATGNVVLVRIALTANQSITALSIGVAA